MKINKELLSRKDLILLEKIIYAMLCEDPTLSNKQISEALSVDRITASRTITRLGELGLIKVHLNKNTRKITIV